MVPLEEKQPRLDGIAGAQRRSQSIRRQISVCVRDIRGV